MQLIAAPILALACCAAAAQSVTLSGSMGGKALLIIEAAPRTMAVGEARQGVKLLAVNPNEATVEIEGRRVLLPLGGAPVNLGGTASEGTGSQIVLTAGSGGHFFAQGSINGRAVEFVVDTGATYIALGQAEADRIGLPYKTGRRSMVGTANGQVAVWRVSLASVRIGDVQVYDVDATVLPAPLPHVLLGNSFLTRFQMRRENDQLTLQKRF